MGNWLNMHVAVLGAGRGVLWADVADAIDVIGAIDVAEAVGAVGIEVKTPAGFDDSHIVHSSV